MKKAVKVFAVMLSAAMSLSLAACGGGKSGGERIYRVGICQLQQHEALDAATEGFKDALTERLGDRIGFDFQNASNDTNACSTIVNKFVSDKVDLIMANATPALTAAYNATDSIPIVGTSITDYATALNIALDRWTGKSGMNVTGSADRVPLDKQAAMVKDLVPDVKTVGIIYCTNEPNSKFQVSEITKEFDKLGIEVKEYGFAESSNLTAVVSQAVEECDALYAPTDNTVADNGDTVFGITDGAGVPLIAGEEGICRKCGVATLTISYYDIGYEAGKMAYEILVNGRDPAEMDIVYTPEEKLVRKYVKDRAEKYGITIPDGYEELK